MPRRRGAARRKPVVAVAMGDFNGVGPEISLRSAVDKSVRNSCRLILVGSTDVYEYYARKLGMRLTLKECSGPGDRARSGEVLVYPMQQFRIPRVSPGKPSVEAGRWGGDALCRSVELCTSGYADAIVTSPTSKEWMNRAGYRYPGQTEMVAELSGGGTPVMMLIAGSFRVALTTVHVPLSRVASRISSKLIAGRLSSMSLTLTNDFGIRRPRIAVLGLNPHAGENGLIGNEERKIIMPAIRRARGDRIDATGPFPADAFFGTKQHEAFDAVLAMYHDQGLIPLKMSGFHKGVNFSSGLPIIRTSPDHGTAYELAGTGKANPGSMIAAIKLAVFIHHHRTDDNT